MSTKKKICFVMPSHWSKKFGGSEYQVKLLIDYLIERNGDKFDIYYICRYASDKVGPLKYRVIRIGKGDSGIRKYGHFFDAFEVHRCLKNLDPDLIYQRVGGGYTGVCAFYVKKSGKKLIWHICDDVEVEAFKFRLNKNFVPKFIKEKFLQYGIRNATYIIGQKKRQDELLRKNYARKCDFINPNFHPRPKNKIKKTDPIKIVWIANYKTFKKPEIFINLAEQYRNYKKVKFLMIGRKDEKIWQHGIQNRIDILNNLEYLGEISLEEVNKILSYSHIFVNTSDHEGFPNTYIQAWMREVPVISLNVDPDDILKKEKIGFHSKTFSQMVKDTRCLIDNEELRKEMGKKAKKYAIENYSIEKIGDRYLKIFEDLIK